jgi:hypothetical protein
LESATLVARAGISYITHDEGYITRLTMFPMAWFRSQQDIDLGILESTTVLWCRKELVGV